MEEAESLELGNLCPQVIHSIFSRIPLKSLVQSKKVSKQWCNFVEHFRNHNPPTTASGLAILLKRHLNQAQLDDGHNHHHHHPPGCFQESIFLRTQEAKLHDEFSVHARFKSNFPVHLIDSCNGLLLYATEDGLSWSYYVCSPFLDQCLPLPHAHRITRWASANLVFEKSCYYSVLCVFLEEINSDGGTIRCKIFSSKSWDWREFNARIFNIDLLLERAFVLGQFFSPSVLCRGRLYWIWSLCMLVYDTEAEFFKLIPLPSEKGKSNGSSNILSQLLWESDGHMYFCHQIDERLCIYKFIGGEGVLDQKDDCNYWMEDCDLWKFNHFVTLKGYVRQEFDDVMDEMMKKFWAKCRIRPCGFNQDLQLLYLLVPPGTIVSYSLETQELEQIWGCGESRGNYAIQRILPFLFKSVDLFLC